MSIEARFRARLGDFSLDAELDIPAAGVTALFGASGAGKTMILRAMAGLDRHPGGFLRVGDATWQDDRRFLPPHRRPLGYVFQEASLFGHLSVRANVEFGQKRVPVAERSVSLARAIELLGIEDMLARRPSTLSGGERQRVAMARALAVSPRLLLMDEPLAALDIKRRQEILPYLDALVRELDIPVVYVSHSPDEVARLADHLLLLQAGKVIGSGPIQDMLTRPDLPLAHGGEAEALIEATVAELDPEYHLAWLEFAGGRLAVPGVDLPPGRRVRARVAARDVSLTLEAQRGTSILNILPATVDALAEDGPAQVTVRLKAGGVPLLAHVTRRSAAALELQPGKRVFAQVKSVAVLS